MPSLFLFLLAIVAVIEAAALIHYIPLIRELNKENDHLVSDGIRRQRELVAESAAASQLRADLKCAHDHMRASEIRADRAAESENEMAARLRAANDQIADLTAEVDALRPKRAAGKPKSNGRRSHARHARHAP